MVTLAVIAVVAALGMGVGAWALVRRSVPVPLWPIAVTGIVAMVLSGTAASLTGAIAAPIAVSIAAASIPISVPLLAASRIGSHANLAMLIASIAWSVVVVPFAIVAPPVFVTLCPPEACVVEDFGGGLAMVVSAGAFLVVPSVATLGRNQLRSGTGAGLLDVAFAALIWAAFIVWLAALEGDVDEYTSGIALAAVVAPAAGAVGWLIVDKARGVDATVGRALRMGLLAGMGVILPGVVAVSLPWALIIGFLGGSVGALTHDAKGMATSAPGTRAAVAALVVGTLGMAAPGIVGARLGFIFAARADVLLTQFAAVAAVAIVAIGVSVPVAIVMRRRAEDEPALT